MITREKVDVFLAKEYAAQTFLSHLDPEWSYEFADEVITSDKKANRPGNIIVFVHLFYHGNEEKNENDAKMEIRKIYADFARKASDSFLVSITEGSRRLKSPLASDPFMKLEETPVRYIA